MRTRTSSVPIHLFSRKVPISPRGDNFVTLHYPPSSVFQTAAFWTVILHWALPTLILPTLVGCMISFNPEMTPRNSDSNNSSVAPLDPLTASIIRLAAQLAYPYSSIATKSDIVGLDVLGSNWRTLSASVGLAFAFAEAIAGAPRVLANTIVREERRLIRYEVEDDEPRFTPGRRAIMAQGQTPENEID